MKNLNIAVKFTPIEQIFCEEEFSYSNVAEFIEERNKLKKKEVHTIGIC